MHERKFVEIGSRLNEVRKALKLVQKEFVHSLGIMDSTLSEYETGLKLPVTEFLMKLRKEYSVNISYILFGEGRMFTYSKDEDKYCIRLSKLSIRQKDAYELLYTFERSRITQHQLFSSFSSLLLRDELTINKEVESAEQDEREVEIVE